MDTDPRPPTRPLITLLARKLRSLADALSLVAERVREAVAREVGDAAAWAARSAAYNAVKPAPARDPEYRDYHDPQGDWGGWHPDYDDPTPRGPRINQGDAEVPRQTPKPECPVLGRLATAAALAARLWGWWKLLTPRPWWPGKLAALASLAL